MTATRSTPEATALELAARQDLAGGPGRVLETLRALAPSLNFDGLREAFGTMGDVPAIQRLGAFLNLAEKGSMPAEMIADWLASKPARAIPLTPGTPSQDTDHLNPAFKVRVPADFITANA